MADIMLYMYYCTYDVSPSVLLLTQYLYVMDVHHVHGGSATAVAPSRWVRGAVGALRCQGVDEWRRRMSAANACVQSARTEREEVGESVGN